MTSGGTHKRFVLRARDSEHLRQEYESSLSKGRAFIADATGATLRERCSLLLEAPSGPTLELPAEAVWVQEGGPGIGFELDLTQTQAEALRSFAEGDFSALQQLTRAEETPSQALTPAPEPEGDAGRQAAFDDPAAPGGEQAPPDVEPGPPQTDSLEPSQEDASEPPEDEAEQRAGAKRTRNLYDRIRRLNTTEQQALARKGSLAERVALERCFSGAVWEGLLQNPQLTSNEVAKIAKKGNLPKPLLNLIVANSAWLSVGEVQRALLNNPRLTGSAVTRVLRSVSRRDLTQIAQQTRYRMNVRTEARRLLKAS